MEDFRPHGEDIDMLQTEKHWLEAEMTLRLERKQKIDPIADPITYHRRERKLNEAIDHYSDLLSMIGEAAILGADQA